MIAVGRHGGALLCQASGRHRVINAASHVILHQASKVGLTNLPILQVRHVEAREGVRHGASCRCPT